MTETATAPGHSRFNDDVKIYTRNGDDGTTGLLYGGRVSKADWAVELAGAVDEAQAVLGMARAEMQSSQISSEIQSADGEAYSSGNLCSLIVDLQRDLWVLMAEVATSNGNKSKLIPGATAVTPAMVEALEGHIDRLAQTYEIPRGFVIPGQDRSSALLDMARVTVRRAERVAWRTGQIQSAESISPDEMPQSQVGPYLNRLSDLCWAMARSQEQRHLLAAERGPMSQSDGPDSPEEQVRCDTPSIKRRQDGS